MWSRLSTSLSSNSNLESSSSGSLRLEERSRDDPIYVPMTNGEIELGRSTNVIHNATSYLNEPPKRTSGRRRGDLTASPSCRSASRLQPEKPADANFLSVKACLSIMFTAALTGLLLMLGSQFSFSVSRFSQQFTKGVTLASNVSDSGSARTFSGDVSKCPGYTLTGLNESAHGLSARLQLAGQGCNAFGVDIQDLTLEVTYETDSRLHVNIYDTRQTQFQIPESVISRPAPPSQSFKETSDLVFNYTPHPFAFWITRKDGTGEPLFDTRVSSLPQTPIPAQDPSTDNSTALDSFQLIFEDQYLQLASALPYDTNIYGLGEVVASSGIRRDVGATGGPGTIQTLWARDSADPIDQNMYGSHPIYLEHRFDPKTETSSSHGVLLLNSNGADILLQTPQSQDNSSLKSLVEYRFLGGTLDFYFFSGPTPQDVMEQYAAVVGTSLWIPYWAFGFHLCRWGYPNVSDTKLQVERMREADIPLEVMWNDIDLYHAFRDFTTDPVSYPADQVKEFIEELHANNQHYIPIVDAAVAHQVNETDIYDPYTRGVELDVWVKNPDGSEYIGQVWPGYTVFPDWFGPNTASYWAEALKNWSDSGVLFSGIWLDMNEISSFCDGSCGSGMVLSNTTVPFLLPGSTGNPVTDYPEGYDSSVSGPSGNITVNGKLTYNGSFSPSSESNIIARGYEGGRLTKRESGDGQDVSQQNTSSVENSPENGSKLGAALLLNTVNEPLINVPPYAIHNGNGPLSVSTLATNSTHHPGYVDLDTHNMWGMMEEKATHNALLDLHPGQRPFLISRSTFPSSGKWTGHWLGDNFSKWQYMYYSIQGVLQFQLFQVPMVGADTGGFNGNTDEELLGRWMMLSAFHPFYRNHNERGAISQEPYRWESVANASRTAIAARYAMLPYWYTLFANTSRFGTPTVRALFWEFPNESELFNVDKQFMVGRDILVTPVLEPNVSSVQGIFPGKGQTIWRDWWTHAVVDTTNGTNVTLSAPLGHIPVHIRSGAAMLLHASPAYTTTETRAGPYSLLISLDSGGSAFGDAYIDNGESLPPTPNVTLTIKAGNGGVVIQPEGSFEIAQKLTQVTVLGVPSRPSVVRVNGVVTGGETWTYESSLEKLVIGGTTSGEGKGIDSDLNQVVKITWS